MERDLSTFAWEDPRLQHLGSVQYYMLADGQKIPSFF